MFVKYEMHERKDKIVTNKREELKREKQEKKVLRNHIRKERESDEIEPHLLASID